jgi:hypothetical protein
MPANLVRKSQRRSRSTPIGQTVGSSAKLIRFWRVNPPQSNALPVNIDSVAVNDGRLP